MTRSEELLEMSKANLINLAAALEPAIILTMDDKKGDMVERILAAEGKLGGIQQTQTDTPTVEKRNVQGLPKDGKLYDLQGNAWNGKYYKVTVSNTETEQGDVRLTVNGWPIRFRRGVQVILPEPYIECLKCAVTKHRLKDPETGKEREIEILQYPYTVEGPVEGPTRIA